MASATEPIPPFQTTFAVPLHCEACIESVTAALKDVPGIQTLISSLPAQTITITGTAPPSLLTKAIQSTGRDAILRGSGASNSAAVSILELPPPHPTPVRGLMRLVQVSPTLTLLDISLRGLPPGKYVASIRTSGDISQGVAGLGAVWGGSGSSSNTIKGQGDTSMQTGRPKGLLGEVHVNGQGAGSALLMKRWAVWEVIGRGMVVERTRDGREGEEREKSDGETVMGVVARSAGVWDNEKTVCSCSGKTVWEEREEQVGRGML